MTPNASSYHDGTTCSNIPAYPHHAVLIDARHTYAVERAGGEARAVTKDGVEYLWFDTEEELKDWIRKNDGISFKAMFVQPFEVSIEVKLTKGNN